VRIRGVAVIFALVLLASTLLACSRGAASSPQQASPIASAPDLTMRATSTPSLPATMEPVISAVTLAEPTLVTEPVARQPVSVPRVLVAPTPQPRPDVSGPQVLTLVGSSLGPITLDPALIRDAESAYLARQIFRGLVRLDNELLVQPDLASRIEVSADGRRYTFYLRPDAVFHDRSPIDADAVVASFNRASDPELAYGDGSALPAYLYFADIVGAVDRMEGIAGSISGLVAVDPTTVQITLRQPSVTFLSMMTGTSALIVDAETARGDDWWVEPNGSGPFVLESLSSSLLLLAGFSDFYDGAPFLSEVRILQGSDRAQPLNLYEGGRVDVVDVPFYSLDRILSPTDYLYPELHVEPQLSSTFLLINPNHVPFDDLNVRLAIAHAFDRGKFVRVGMDGKVELASGIVPPGILGRSWESVPMDYDLDAATSRYGQAGNLELNPTIYGSLATTIKSVLERDLGMQIDVVVPEWPLFAAKLTEGSLPAFVLSWIADYPDPSNFLYSMFHSASPDNYIRYANPVVDAMLSDAAREQNEEARALLYLMAQQAVINDGVLVPLYHDVSYTLIKPHVRGLDLTPVGIGYLDAVWIER
jgi:oligopeptide transport system substrate-binding protein